ncbi:MAG: hypothetical protein K8I03_00055 [Ignavibacteria bacterium]|nr:hypothetical protein [Ignavibacteria bacterium]
MTKANTKSDSQLIAIPLKEYNYLKSVVNKIGKKIKLENDSDFLTPLQVKKINEIEEKIGNGDWTDFVDYETFKKSLSNKNSKFVQNKNRKTGKQIHS